MLVDIPLDSYEDPMSLLCKYVTFDGRTPIYLLPDPDDNCIVWVSDAPFTVKDIEEVKKDASVVCMS